MGSDGDSRGGGKLRVRGFNRTGNGSLLVTGGCICPWLLEVGHLRSFDMRIVNLGTGSYLRQTSAKALATAEKDKKDKYLQPCLELRCTFIPMV